MAMLEGTIMIIDYWVSGCFSFFISFFRHLTQISSKYSRILWDLITIPLGFFDLPQFLGQHAEGWVWDDHSEMDDPNARSKYASFYPLVNKHSY
jgi:hypothetical protein